MHCVGAFSTRLCDNETDAGRDVFFGENIWNFLPQRRRLTARAFPTRESQLKERFSASFGAPGARQGHLTHGLEGLDVDFFLHKDEIFECNSDVVGVQVHRLRETGAMEQLCHSNAFFSSTLLSSASSRSRRCLQRRASHVEGVVQARKKKCGFMV